MQKGHGMQCSIHPTTASDLSDLVVNYDLMDGSDWGDWEESVEKLLQACVLSTQVWTAMDRQEVPLAFMGAAPASGPDSEERQCGFVWFVLLTPFDAEDAELVEAVSGMVRALLGEYGRLENMVHAGETWALDLFRSAGFTIGPGERQPGGIHHRVWIEQGDAQPRILH